MNLQDQEHKTRQGKQSKRGEDNTTQGLEVDKRPRQEKARHSQEKKDNHKTKQDNHKAKQDDQKTRRSQLFNWLERCQDMQKVDES